MIINGEQLGLTIGEDSLIRTCIANAEKRCSVYHYCEFESFLEIISNKSFKFNRIDKVNDKKENEMFGNSEIAKLFFVSCFSKEVEESIPLWHIYTENNWGIRLGFYLEEPSFREKFINYEEDVCGKEEFKSNKVDTFKLYGSNSKKEVTNSEWVVDISQKDIEYDVNAIKENPINCGYIYNMLSMGMFKSVAWNYENETRLVAVMRTTAKNIEIPEYGCLYVPVDFSALKKLEIRFNPWMTDKMKHCIKDAVVRYIPDINIFYENSVFEGVITRK